MMKRSFRDAWTAKLRSGEFTQGRLVLAASYDINCRCCLGVAYAVDEQDVPVNETGGSKYARLPLDSDCKKWGLRNSDVLTLSHMNDEGISFSEIADYIDAWPVDKD